MIKMLHKMGIKSQHAYIAGAASIGFSIASWMVSRNAKGSALERADHWGIFVGEWAPTFFALGVALRIEETHRDLEQEQEQDADMLRRSTAGVKQPAHSRS
ncbi:hypothetical protein [Nonomuraea cavernae]|uniref:Uncharacterized protein n=1 Tax=Nonomuraea cavernae TaxID=2045107 RepID=A0A917ZEC1_9ACTN|nr:hypothetical protein [Nonomuraea cavernae]MCA2187574.1 hypothetical protein [Nonomuraea cavernae]GGO80289.1 hypothetical protein GCM10012289_66610 [Nonomuraea cavernae]